MQKIDGGFFSQKQLIHDFSLDRHGNLALSHFQQYAQEVGTQDLITKGYPHTRLLQMGCVYLLVCLSIEWKKPLLPGQTYTFFTVPRAPQGVRCFRDIWVEDALGNRLAEVSTVWATVDPVERKLIEPDQSPIQIPFFEKQTTMAESKKVRLQKNAPKVGEQAVLFTHLDLNGHMNNCKYTDLFCDFCGVDFSQYRLVRYNINYRKEALCHDIIVLYGQQEEKEGVLTAYLHGKIGDCPCFVAEATFTKQ